MGISQFHGLAMLAWLTHLGFAAFCTDWNEKFSIKKYKYKCAVLKVS